MQRVVSTAITFLCISLSVASGSARSGEKEAPVTAPTPLPLVWCLERAERASPRIAADAARAQAALHRVRPAGSLDDPFLRAGLVNLPLEDGDLRSTPMSGIQFDLTQKFPFPGLLQKREQAAGAAAAAAGALEDDQRVHVRAAVERAWTELGFDQRALAITDENIDLLRQLTKIAAARYRVGTGRQQDVLRAQVTLTDLLDQRLRREAAIRTSEATLADLLDLPPETRFGLTEDLRERAPLPKLEALLAKIEETSPRLFALSARVEQALRRKRVAVLEGYPDFNVGLGYRVRSSMSKDPVHGQDFLSAGVTLRLPMDRKKWREYVAERDAQVRHARAQYRAGRARVREGARHAFAQLMRADGEVVLLESGLVPQTRQSLESSRSGYEVNKVDFLSLIDSQVSLLDAELSLVRSIALRRASFAALEAVVGEELR